MARVANITETVAFGLLAAVVVSIFALVMFGGSL
jgi:hypothetical protein